MKNILMLALVMGAAGSVQGTQLVLWNFNDNNTVADGGLNASLSSAALLGTTATFASGGGSSDVAATNRGWNTTSYPTQGSGSGTEGARYNAPTTGGMGYKDIVVEFDLRTSNTASKFYRFEYTVDGTNFVTTGIANPIIASAGGDTWNNNIMFDLSSITGVNNNANFGFQIVSIFDPSGSGYLAANSGSTYAGTGTVRFDMVEVNGQPVPEPATLAAIAVGLSAIAARKRKRS